MMFKNIMFILTTAWDAVNVSSAPSMMMSWGVHIAAHASQGCCVEQRIAANRNIASKRKPV